MFATEVIIVQVYIYIYAYYKSQVAWQDLCEVG